MGTSIRWISVVHVLVLMLTVNCAHGADFKLGMLCPFRHPRLGWENNAAAATLAVTRAQNEGLVAGHNISVLWRDDQCSPAGGTGGTVSFREEDVDALIGPPCSASTTSAGLLASFWNLPMFSQASTDPSLADKDVYSTLVRLGPPFNKMGRALVEVFKHYEWDRVVIISKRKTDQKNVFCDYSSRSMEVEFRLHNINIADFIYINSNIEDSAIDNVLDRAKQRGRIIIVCTEITADRRRILLRAQDKGMTDGSYVYIMPDHLPPTNIGDPWRQNDDSDARARLAFQSAFQVSVAEMAGPEVEAFRDLVTEKMAEAPWNYNYTKSNGIRGSVYSPFLHDVVYLYLLVLNETLAANQDHRNGTEMFEKAKGKVFRGLTGTVKVDNNGDREPDYWVWALAPDQTEYTVALEVGLTSSTTQKIRTLQTVVWGTETGLPPPSSPACGFSDELCPPEPSNVVMVTAVVVAVVMLLGVGGAALAITFYRRAKFERDLQLQLWRVDRSDINYTKTKITGSVSQLSLHAASISLTSSHITDSQLFSQLGYYRGNLVAVKNLEAGRITLDRDDLTQLKAMKEMHHENLNMFIGLCVNEDRPCILSAYCNKGSLEDIIENEDINLDWMFKISLINDMTNAMTYIHSTPIRYHGNLKSSNCLVDNRWVLKVADYGLSRIRNHHKLQSESDHRLQTGLFWTSPELLQIDVHQRTGTQKADVYAYGIVLFEILYRKPPYDTITCDPADIVRRVRVKGRPPFRPTSLCSNEAVEWHKDEKVVQTAQHLLAECWADEYEVRPTFSAIKHEIAKLHNEKRINIVDNMVRMLEKYAVNLEGLVEQRTELLMEEKKKTDTLLYRMLPPTVAEQLKSGFIVPPEVYSDVTIYFSDIVGFTKLASDSSPIEIVDFLNELYTAFDATIAMHDVYKVETIGDAYMAVSGLPVRNGLNHCVEIANMSLDLLACASCFKIHHKPNTRLQLRIGLHSGPCAAGVVGRIMPRYCLFGDTVNMASRMESTGEAMKIHLSQTARDWLQQTNMYRIELRGETQVKGKGLQITYWLEGRFTMPR